MYFNKNLVSIIKNNFYIEIENAIICRVLLSRVRVRVRGLVPEQSRKAVQADILIAIRRFMATGLNTGLKPTFGVNKVKHGSDNLEDFLTALEKPSSRRLLNADVLTARTGKKLKSTTSFKNLKNPDMFVSQQIKQTPQE